MPARRASIGVRKCTTLPSSRISPASGTSAPDSALINVDLPAPLSPITARISPARSSKSAWSSAVTWPYRLTRPRASMTSAVALPAATSARSATRELIRRHGENHQDSRDEDLVDGRYAHEREAVPKDADDQRAHERPEYRASASEQARAAEDDGRDRVEVFGLAGVRVSYPGARDRQQRRDAVQHAGEDIHGQD